MEEADRHRLGPGHSVEVDGLEADKGDIFSGDLLLDLLHVCNEPQILRYHDGDVPVICGKQFQISANTIDNCWF